MMDTLDRYYEKGEKIKIVFKADTEEEGKIKNRIKVLFVKYVTQTEHFVVVEYDDGRYNSIPIHSIININGAQKR